MRDLVGAPVRLAPAVGREQRDRAPSITAVLGGARRQLDGDAVERARRMS